MSIALHVIAKDQVNEIERIVNSYEKYFDELCFAIDDWKAFNECVEKFKDAPKVRLFKYEWDEEEKEIGFPKFDKKRNFLADKTESQWYLRLDTDDYILDAEKTLGEVLKKIQSLDFDCVYTKYIYSVDADGNCDAFQWRETIIKKSQNHYWKKNIHENIFADDPSKFKACKDTSLVILHKKELDSYKSSGRRNFKFLMYEFQRDKENTDPRTLSYLGKMHMGMGEFKKAIPFLQMLIMKSGWDDDIYYAYIALSKCYLQLEKSDDAIDACLQAMKLMSHYPDSYLQLCQVYIERSEFSKAIHWGEIGATLPPPQTMYVTSPTEYTYRAIMNLAMAYLGAGQIDKAKKFYDKAAEIAPSNDFIKNNKALFEDAYDAESYYKSLRQVVLLTQKVSPSDTIKLVSSIPDKYLKDERIVSLRNSFIAPKSWSDKSIVIFCGPVCEDWGPPSVINGIGGSEEAVIYLSKELVKLGWEVTVYNACGDYKGIYEGVEYKSFFEINPKDNFNIFVAWRQNIFKAINIKAKQKIVWMHDVPADDQFPPDEVNTFDKILVLSQFHKSLLPKHIPEDKIVVSSNGINLADFKKNSVRNPKRIIYTSSYDRGIEHLLNMWPDILKEVPDAELHLFYGWNTYDTLVKTGQRSPVFKEKMTSLINQPRVFEHGRIGHKQLVTEFMKSGVYAYPCHFEEISCISAMKAQACGCVPIVTDFAALKETVKHGIKIEGVAGDEEVNKKFKEELIKILKDEAKQEEIRKDVLSVKESFGWDRVANQWSGVFKNQEFLRIRKFLHDYIFGK